MRPHVPDSARAPARTRIPVLMYHEVSPRPDPAFRKSTVSPSAFRAQMRWLRTAGYQPITLTTLVRGHSDPRVLPPSPVVITFDDGFRDAVRYAGDVLREYAFPAVFYLVATLVGRSSRWMAAEGGPALPLADWPAIRGLLAEGFECGSHTLTHPRLAALPDTACRHELAASRELLEQHLDRRVAHVAYPFGSWSPRVCEIAAEAGYTTGCTVGPGIAGLHEDPMRLPRVPVTGFDSLADFACRLRTTRTFGETCRRLVHRTPVLEYLRRS